jgi:hypothetical protein
VDYQVETQRYYLNWLLCWHGKSYRRILKSNNGVVSYCDKCKRKRLGIHDFGTERFK